MYAFLHEHYELATTARAEEYTLAIPFLINIAYILAYTLVYNAPVVLLFSKIIRPLEIAATSLEHNEPRYLVPQV
jgi:hypothetical protein